MTIRKVASIAADTALLIWICGLGLPLVLLSAVLSDEQPNDVTRMLRGKKHR